MNATLKLFEKSHRVPRILAVSARLLDSSRCSFLFMFRRDGRRCHRRLAKSISASTSVPHTAPHCV